VIVPIIIMAREQRGAILVAHACEIVKNSSIPDDVAAIIRVASAGSASFVVLGHAREDVIHVDTTAVLAAVVATIVVVVVVVVEKISDRGRRMQRRRRRIGECTPDAPPRRRIIAPLTTPHHRVPRFHVGERVS
jgi:hypothetical protein